MRVVSLQPKFKSDWKEITTKAWSFRLMLIASVFAGIEALLPLATEMGWFDQIPVGLVATITFVVIVGAMLSRVLMQTNMAGGSNIVIKVEEECDSCCSGSCGCSSIRGGADGSVPR